jgi:hypothetical protein
MLAGGHGEHKVPLSRAFVLGLDKGKGKVLVFLSVRATRY